MDLKENIGREIEARKADILASSRRIHAAPETAFREFETSRFLRTVLETEGFEVEAPLASLETAFRAVHRFSSAKPRLTFTVEMDALPGLGHACGHNIIGTAGTFAAVVLKSVLGPGTRGTIEVIGTPAEEKGSGKVVLLQAGVFRDSDAVLQVHPHMLDSVVCQAMARRAVTVEYFGKKAHAAASPGEGANALDALVMFYHSAAIPRSKLPPGCLFHGIIDAGGEATNVIPDYARGRFSIRADDMARLESFYNKVAVLARAAAEATGCRLKMTETAPAATTFKRNRILEDLFAGLFEDRGRTEPRKTREFYGSTDLANVSQAVPAIEPMIKAGPFPIHTEEFARDAVGPGGDKALLDGVYFLAMAGARLLTEPGLLERVRHAFAGAGGGGPAGIL